jgi:hypothetical protein
MMGRSHCAGGAGLPFVWLPVLIVACSDRVPAQGTSATEGTETEASDTGMFEPPRPPDLGVDAVVCGTPEESAATDEAIAMLAGCEIYLGKIVIPYATDGALASLTSLRVIGGNFAGSAGDPNLLNLEGLNQLEWAGSFKFSQSGLQDLSAMANLAGVDGVFQFFEMRKAVDCRGLEGLRAIGGTAAFVINDELASLDGLSGLEWIGGDLKLEGNPKLTSLSGLSSLRQVDGDVIIQFNAALPQAEIDALLSRIDVGGEITIE